MSFIKLKCIRTGFVFVLGLFIVVACNDDRSVEVNGIASEKKIAITGSDTQKDKMAKKETPENPMIYEVYNDLTDLMVATEAALYEGKTPVATQAEMEQMPETREWIGWRSTNLLEKLVINHFKDEASHKELVIILGGDLAGEKIILNRAGGDRIRANWRCHYYKKSLSASNPAFENCKIQIQNPFINIVYD